MYISKPADFLPCLDLTGISNIRNTCKAQNKSIVSVNTHDCRSNFVNEVPPEKTEK